MGRSAFGKASAPTAGCRSSAEVRFTAQGVILHQLLTGIQVVHSQPVPMCCSAGLHQQVPAGLGAAAGGLSGKGEKQRKGVHGWVAGKWYLAGYPNISL